MKSLLSDLESNLISSLSSSWWCYWIMASGWNILARLRYAVLISVNEAVRSTLSTSYRLTRCTGADEEYGLTSIAVAMYALTDRLEEENLVSNEE
ncbi:hypothetical protein CFP56_014006 [Quercus suber]|uniref:Uncharacterized protein n=1 Tax=Quercus suber TaxID=58331 RepID=A0AAW0KS76_QUESU|nr:hypothetical protein CFP56_58015 [Quercus suber]